MPTFTWNLLSAAELEDSARAKALAARVAELAVAGRSKNCLHAENAGAVARPTGSSTHGIFHKSPKVDAACKTMG